MGAVEGPVLVLLLASIDALGLVSASLVRISEGSRCEAWLQRFFLGCLGLVGATAIASLGLHPGCWLSCGATLAVMVLTVTCDFHKAGCATVW